MTFNYKNRSLKQPTRLTNNITLFYTLNAKMSKYELKGRLFYTVLV
jgi:hypothetical protein